VTTLGWIAAVFLGPVESEATLRNFYRRIRPAGPGWKAVTDRARLEGQLVDCQSTGRLGREIFFALTGCVAIYGLLFSTGYLLYGQYRSGVISLTLSMVAALCLWLNWKKVASGE
jgi:hypothetical protein